MPFATLLTLLGPEGVWAMAGVNRKFAKMLCGGYLYRHLAEELRRDKEQLSILDGALDTTKSIGPRTPLNACRKSVESRSQETAHLVSALHPSYVFGATRQKLFKSLRPVPYRRGARTYIILCLSLSFSLSFARFLLSPTYAFTSSLFVCVH